jgi:hypothetical protein
MEKNKTRTYLSYAIGEIVLVVIGILIALSINNWNEEKNTKAEERKVLSEIKAALETDLYHINANIDEANKSIASIQIIKKQIQLTMPTNDSLGYHFAQFLDWSRSDINTGPYETLKTKGLDLISNDNLRNEIMFHFEQLVKQNIDQNIYLSNNYYLEYCSKLFNTVGYMSKDATGNNNLIPNDFETLKRDVIFRNLLNTKEDELNYKKVVLSISIKSADHLITMIHKELID